MKPEEIMIGDLVIHGFGGIGKITEIDSKTVVIKDDGFDTGDGMNEVSFALNELKPIPLTAEILAKNGFSLQCDNTELFKLDTYWLGCELGTFRIHNLNKDWWQFGLAKIRNVHELQHALRLCGIDREIEI